MSETRYPTVTEAGPVHDQREIDAVVAVLQAPGVSPSGPRWPSSSAGAPSCSPSSTAVMVNSGTSALWLAVDLLGCEPGDEVITSPLTFSSDIAPLVRNGIVPAFVDVEPDTLQIDVTKIEAMIGPRTKAILTPNLVGNCPDWDAIRAIADRARTARGRGQLRRARLVPARHAHRDALRHLGDQLRPRSLDHRREQRRHDRGRRPRVVRPDARAPPVGPSLRAVPVRQQAGRRRPLRHARRRHALRHGLPVRGHGLQLRAVGDRRRVRQRAARPAGRVQRSGASRTSPALDEVLAHHEDKVVRAAHDPRGRDDLDAVPVPARTTASTAPRCRSSCSSGASRRAWCGPATSCASPGSPTSPTARPTTACPSADRVMDRGLTLPSHHGLSSDAVGHIAESLVGLPARGRSDPVGLSRSARDPFPLHRGAHRGRLHVRRRRQPLLRGRGRVHPPRRRGREALRPLGQRGQAPLHGVRLDHDRPRQHQRAEPDVQPDRDAGRVPRAAEGAAGAHHRRDRHPAQRHAQGVRPARAAPRGLPGQPRAHRHDRRAERGEVPPLPDARRLRRGPHARQRADGLQGVPRVQPVAGGGLGLRVPGPPVRAAVHPDARPRPRRRRARVPAEQGHQGGVDPPRARPTAGRPPTRRGTGSGR